MQVEQTRTCGHEKRNQRTNGDGSANGWVT